MLVLSRKKKESILIKDLNGKLICKIVLADIRGEKARIGIEADKEFEIIRGELEKDWTGHQFNKGA